MRNVTAVVLAVAVAILASCGGESTTGPGVTDPNNPGNMNNGRISITNEDPDLDSRVTYYNDDVPIDGSPKTTSQRAAFSLSLVAEVAPPTLEGRVLQATAVEMRGNFAIVSYGMRGPDYLGAIDVFNITNKRRPRLESSALFSDSDVNSVSYSDGFVYMAQATSDPSFAFPAVGEVMSLQGHNLILDDNRRVGLRSFAGTSIFSSGAAVFATSGDAGGLEVFDPVTWLPTSFVELHDARWVHADGGKLAVVQGTPGQLTVFDAATMAVEGTYSFDGADIPESKSTVEIVGGKAFVAGGPAGVQVLSLSTGTVLGTVPRPDPAGLGLDPSVVVTNAVSADGSLLFVSNGEAGVYVAEADDDFEVSGSAAPQNLTMLGKLRFGDLQSVNHVAFRNDYLIIAAGLGGIKIVEVRR